jgi:hypothetical protein
MSKELANMGKSEATPTKFGSGHLAAMGRLGLKELANLTLVPGNNIAQPGGEYGIFGQPTPGQIADAIEPSSAAPPPSVLAAHLPEPSNSTRTDPWTRDNRDLDRE